MQQEYVVLTGLSGAGRSTAANALEDLGWFVIDNMPPSLIPKISELVQAPNGRFDQVALALGSEFAHERVGAAIQALRETGARVRIVYLEASTGALVRRYESTRRRHPYGEQLGLTEAIENERTAMEPIKSGADMVIDTSKLNVHELKARIVGMFAEDSPEAGMRTRVLSFGFKHGIPLDTDMVIDCRFLPNPHWVEELRPLTGKDEAVQRYVMGQDITELFVERLNRLLTLLLPAYVQEGKSYFTVALGCTGGKHRSVTIAEELGRRLASQGVDLHIEHRDMER